MLLLIDPESLQAAARDGVARSAWQREVSGGKVSEDKAAGAANRVDQYPAEYQWLLGVQTTEHAGGRTVVVRADGVFGFGQDASWWSGFSARTEALCNAISGVAEKARLARATNAVPPGLLVLDLNTPGGMAAGWSDVVGAVRACKAAGVRVEALVHEKACSLGMMLALLADRVVMTPSAIVGSLGVMVENVDLRAMYAEQGVKIEAIVSDGSEAKVDGAPYQGLSDEGRALHRQRVTDMAGQIIADIASVGSRDAAAIKAMFDGRVYGARQAMAWANGQIAGVVDPQAYFDALGRGEEPAVSPMATDAAAAGAADAENDDDQTPPNQETNVSDQNKNVAATAAQIEAAMGERYSADVAMGYLKKGLSLDAVAKEETARIGKLLGEAEAALAAERKASGEKIAAAETAKAAAEAKLAEITGQSEAAKAKIDGVLGGKVPATVKPVETGSAGALGGINNAAAGGYEAEVKAYMAKHNCAEAIARYHVERARPDLFAEWQKSKKG